MVIDLTKKIDSYAKWIKKKSTGVRQNDVDDEENVSDLTNEKTPNNSIAT